MTAPDTPNLGDVMATEESAPRDQSQHAKGYDRPDDEALQHRTEQERQLVGSDDADPAGAEEPDAPAGRQVAASPLVRPSTTASTRAPAARVPVKKATAGQPPP